MSYCLLSQSLPSTLCSASCCVLLLGVTVSQGALEEDCNAGGDKDFLIPVYFLLGFYGLPGPVGSTLATLLCSISTSRAVLSLEVTSSKSLSSSHSKVFLCSTALRMVAASCSCSLILLSICLFNL